MDAINIVPEGSDVSIESEEEAEVKVDPFQSSNPTWATRYHCLQAYCCFVLSYLTTLKFCLTVGKYGFVIFVPYWAYNLFYGVASVLVEIHLGRYVIGSVARAWDMCPLSKGILWCLFGTTFFTIVHDYLSNSYLLKYLFWSFRDVLPWESCDAPWTDNNCYLVGHKEEAISKCNQEHSSSYCQNKLWEMAGTQFWKYRVKATDEISSIVWSLTGLGVSVLLSFIINYKGIRSIEKYIRWPEYRNIFYTWKDAFQLYLLAKNSKFPISRTACTTVNSHQLSGYLLVLKITAKEHPSLPILKFCKAILCTTPADKPKHDFYCHPVARHPELKQELKLILKQEEPDKGLRMGPFGIEWALFLFPLFVYPTIVLWLLLSCVTFIVPKAMYGFISLWDLEWSHLLTMEIWLDGFSDVIYYLGLGKLTLSFISSHGRFDDNILLDVLIASFGSLFVCALIITPVLSIITSIREDEGHVRGDEKFSSIDHIFVFMSEALTFYPYPKALWAVLTYLNWFLMSTSAQALSVLGVIEAVEGLLKHRPNLFFWISLFFALISFSTAALFIFFPVLFEVNLGPSTATILLLTTITWQHCYGISRFNKDYYFMMGSPLPIFVKGCWICVLVFPTIVNFLNLLHSAHQRPLPGMIYIYTAIPILVFLGSMFNQMYKLRKQKKSVLDVFKPKPDWGPESENLRKSRIVFDSTTASKELLYRQELCNRPFKRPPEFAEQNIVQLI